MTAISPEDPEGSEKLVTSYCDQFSNSDICKEMVKDIASSTHSGKEKIDGKLFKSTDAFTQLYWLIWRAGIITWTDYATLAIRFVQIIVLGVLFGIIYLRDYGSPYVGLIDNPDTCKNDTNNGTGSGPPIQSSDIMNINGALFICLTQNSFTFVFLVVLALPLIVSQWRVEHYSGLYAWFGI